MKRFSLILLIILGMITGTSFSQTTGKIAGQVLDQETGEPLIGTNIIIVGTNKGAVADSDGEFYIINLPPGSYDIMASMIGYAPMVVEDIRVFVNRTYSVDFKLRQSVVEGEVVTVTAEKIAIKKDQTNSVRNISAEDIEILPAESIDQVVEMQPGVVGSHFRGGRSNEVTFLIDGVAVTDAFTHEQTTSEVNPEVVADVEVITGTFNAEYGDAMSGVVNVVTKSGSNQLEGSASFNLGNYYTSHDDVFGGLSNDEFDRLRDVKFAISGPVLKDRIHFIVNVRSDRNLGHLTGLRLFNVDDYSNYTAENEDEWHTESNGDSLIVPLNSQENYSAFGKLTFKPSNSLRISTSMTWNKSNGRGYNHAERFIPDRTPSWHNETTMSTISLNHMLSKAAFYDLKLSFSEYRNGYYLYENPLDDRYVHDEYSRSNGSWFVTGGQYKGHTKRSEKKIDLNLDFNWQINKKHSLKTGIDVNEIDLHHEYHNIRNRYEGSGYESSFVEDIETGKISYIFYEPFIQLNQSTHTDSFGVKPFQAAFYIQDKMELTSMVVNLGLRYDYFDPRTVYPTNYRNPGNQEYFEQAERNSDYLNADPKKQISPRLGLSYSLGKTALLRFAYGHFLQLPSMNYYYQNSSFLLGTSDYGVTMGNAQLNPQKTIQYEVGLFQQLTDAMSLEVAVWYKDIYDLVTATVYTTYNQRRYGVYTNKEYGNARGLEIKYDFRQSALSMGVNYTLGYTKGIADNPNSSFSRAGAEQDPVNKLIPMSWDQRHTFNIYVGYNTAKYGATLMSYLNSGQPYTWNAIPQSSISAINLFPNNQYRPTKISLDLNAFYKLGVVGGMDMKFTLLIYNLLDRLNENWVNGQTGRAYTAVVQETDILGHRSVFSNYEDTYQNPSMYAAPRLIKIGLGITF